MATSRTGLERARLTYEVGIITKEEFSEVRSVQRKPGPGVLAEGCSEEDVIISETMQQAQPKEEEIQYGQFQKGE